MGNEDNGSAVYKIVALTFAGEDTAKQNLELIKDSGVLEGSIVVSAVKSRRPPQLRNQSRQ